MEKRQRRILSCPFLPPHPSFISSLVKQVTPAAAERQERSDRVSEEASYPLYYHYLPYAPSLHFILPHKHFR
jgi:hypothetical protein